MNGRLSKKILTEALREVEPFPISEAVMNGKAQLIASAAVADPDSHRIYLSVEEHPV